MSDLKLPLKIVEVVYHCPIEIVADDEVHDADGKYVDLSDLITLANSTAAQAERIKRLEEAVKAFDDVYFGPTTRHEQAAWDAVLTALSKAEGRQP
jgi:hypothetical protein